MPITQDRFIKIVTYAETLLETFDALKRNVKTNAQATTALVNSRSTLEHTPPGPARETITELTDALSQLYHMMTETEVPQEMRKTLIIEQEHFKKHRRANEVLAIYKYRKRHAEELMAASQAQIPKFFDLPDTTPATPTLELRPETIVEDPGLKKLREDIAKAEALKLPIAERQRRRQEAIERGEAQAEEFVPRSDAANVFPPDADAKPLVQAEADAAQRRKGYAKGIKPLIPSDEELRDSGKIEPGTSVL